LQKKEPADYFALVSRRILQTEEMIAETKLTRRSWVCQSFEVCYEVSLGRRCFVHRAE